MVEVVEVLRAARAKIEKPECWIRYELARDYSGNWVGVCSPEARCFCIIGALASTSSDYEAARLALLDVLPSGFCGAVDFNDAQETTHADVLALFDRAIASAEAP
jgi:hypothetical protein